MHKRGLEHSENSLDFEDNKKSKMNLSAEVAKLNSMHDSVIDLQNDMMKKGDIPMHSTPIIAKPLSVIDDMKIAETVLSEAKASIKNLLPDDPNDKMHQLATALTSAMSNAVIKILSASMKQMVENVTTAINNVAMSCFQKSTDIMSRSHDPAIVSLTRKNYYYNESNEQYSRRESVRIHGVPYTENESVDTVEQKARKVLNDAGVTLDDRDISILHRAGKAKNGTKPILVKFVTRMKRNEVMSKKKNLKGKDGYKNIFITDDLTPLRMRLLGYIKNLEGVKKAWSFDGKIKVEMERKVKME